MILVTEWAGLFGPYASVEMFDNRAVCDTTTIHFTVVGPSYALDIQVPMGRRAEDFDLIDGVLVLKNP